MANGPEDSPGAAAHPRPGPLELPHRGGTRVQIGAPIHVGGEKPWMCAVKLMGRKREPGGRSDTEGAQDEATQTLLLRTGRGGSPEEAQRNALAQVTHFYGLPEEPPPQPVIQQKPSEPPPRPEAASPRPSWLGRLLDFFRR